MCGIIGIKLETESEKLVPMLLSSLSYLESRGYDSAGITVFNDTTYKVVGDKDVVSLLRKRISQNLVRHMGIGHNRWATHGDPSETNAHPHTDATKRIHVVHNGIIENYLELKKELEEKGVIFVSETDTEVIPHLIAEELKKNDDFKEAVLNTLKKLEGAYGLAIMDMSDPNVLIAAKMGSDLYIGIRNNDFIVSSDADVIARITERVIPLLDGDVAIMNGAGYDITTIDNVLVNRPEEKFDEVLEDSEKDEHEHFMIKEILQAPKVILDSLRGRLFRNKDNWGYAKLGGLIKVSSQLRKVERLIIVGCGTSYNAGLIGKMLIEEYAGIPVEVYQASEFRYSDPIVSKNTAVLGISQSGTTTDTHEALKAMKERGILTLGIVNKVGSQITRTTDAGVYNHIGPEIAVASTKAFLSQVLVLGLIGLYMGRQRSLSIEKARQLVESLQSLSLQAEIILKMEKEEGAIEKLAEEFKDKRDFLFMGRLWNYPTALEAALKLKEVAYINAQGYSAAEMKHGTIALIDENFPTVAIVPDDPMYKKMFSNIKEIKARKGKVIAVATHGNKEIKEIADHVIYIPKTLPCLTPILAMIPLQLFAYHVACAKGVDPDKPKNLAKTVTVE